MDVTIREQATKIGVLMFSLPFFLGLFPLVVMVVLIINVKMPVYKAVLITLALVLGITYFFFDASPTMLTNAVAYGAIKGLWPIAIVIFGAIYAYNLMQQTGAISIIRDQLSRVTDDRRLLLLLIAWGFGGFLEAAAGFSTAVAIPLGILMALGFNPIRAAIAALVADTTATVFGAVGIPLTVMGDMLHTPLVGMQGASVMVVAQLAILNILIPFFLVVIMEGSVKALKGIFFVTLMTGVFTLVPQFIIALFVGPELTAFGGAIVSMAVMLVLFRRMNGKTPAAYKIEASHDEATASRSEVLRAVSIYVMMFLFILVCSPLFPSVVAYLNQFSSSLSFPVTETKTLKATFAWITTPGMLILFASLIGGVLFQRATPSMIVKTLFTTLNQLKFSALAIAVIVAMATVMDLTGLIAVVAQPLFDATGRFYPFFAPLIGGVGTFVTGSVTNANVLFGNLQTIAANHLSMDPTWLVAANAAGATATKMLAPQSITIAVSSAGLTNADSTLMKGTAPWALLYVLIVCAVVGLTSLFFM